MNKVNPTVELQKQDEKEKRELAYQKISEEYGEGVVSALKAHFDIYDSSFYMWLADLYDPGEYDEDGNPIGGGFYYSNSARDNAGFYIDLESTMQTLGFLRSSGMLDGCDGKLSAAIPERMQKEMIAFALSCQSSEDGYFYHRQWGKDIAPARRGRDLGWATQLLSAFGVMPYWNTPNGWPGANGDPKQNKDSSVTDKSSSENINSEYEDKKAKWPEYLRSVSRWREYLEDYVKDISTRSYPIGHVVAEQAGQIRTREKEALENREEAGYIAVVEEIFGACQNPENGLWEKDVTYDSVNGLMKILALYNILGIKFNHAEQAFKSAKKIALLLDNDLNGKGVVGSVDVYNPWIAITRIFSNINTHGEAEKTELLRCSLRESAEEMIRATTEKTKKFRKPDGSFGYTQSYSPKKSQGVSVAVPETVEGDVNGGTIALVGVTSNMLSALGIVGVNIYSPSDFSVFIERAMSREHIEKE